MEYLAFFVALLSILVVWYFKNYHESFVKASKLPGPTVYPLIGNALMFLGKSPSQLLKQLEKLVKEHGRTVRIMVGPQVQILISDPKDCEVILGSQKLIDKSDEYDFIGQWLGKHFQGMKAKDSDESFRNWALDKHRTKVVLSSQSHHSDFPL